MARKGKLYSHENVSPSVRVWMLFSVCSIAIDNAAAKTYIWFNLEYERGYLWWKKGSLNSAWWWALWWRRVLLHPFLS